MSGELRNYTIRLKPGVLEKRQAELAKQGRFLPEARMTQHPDRWWGLTREYGDIKLGAIVKYKGKQLRVRRIDRLAERPFMLVRLHDNQTTVDVYRDEFELIEQGDGRIHSRRRNDE